jgi:LuxR family maltose regulon positive regulatory protein
MSTQILMTKLHIPLPRPQLVHRSRLIERINEGLQRRPSVTLISAPAGFGKTTLVSEWVRQTDLPITWLSLDERDNDPIHFLNYFVTSLQQIVSEIDQVAQDMLQTSPAPPPETLMTILINQIDASPIDVQYIFVLDDYHLIHNPIIHHALTFLLDHLPPQLHLVITTRVDPPLPLARLRARGQLVELRAQDLRFTVDETATFLNQVMGLRLSAEDIAALEARTEGWIAGLQLAALSMQGRATERVADFIAAFSGSHRHVIDYLAEEVMAQQSDDIHDFLCQTSILNQLTPPLCNAVTGRRDSEVILTQLEQANLFLILLDDQRNWYRYHHLFADFLRSHLNQDLPDQVPELHRRASEWYEQQGLSTAAIEHALSAKDFKRAAHLIEEAADTTLIRSEVTTLQGWIEALPDDVIRVRPLLCVYHAWALVLNGSPLEVAESRLQDALKADTAGSVTGEMFAFRVWLAALQGDTRHTLELSGQALELLPEKSLFLRGIVTASLGLVYIWSGDVEAASRAFAEAVRVGQQTGNLIITGLAQCCLALLAMIQGQLHKTKTLLEQALASAVDGQGRRRPIAGVALIGLGWLLLEWNDLEGATRQLIEGIELTKKWSEIGALPGYIGLALARQAQGDIEGANEAIQTAQELAIKFDAIELDDFMVAAYQVRLWVAQGNLEAALRWAEERGLTPGPALSEVEGEAEGLDRGTDLSDLEKEINKASSPFLRALEYMGLARLYIAQGRSKDALAILKPLFQTAKTAGWIWYVIEILILQALAYQHQGDTAQALTALEQALSLAEPEGCVHVFINEGASMSKLLRQAAAQGIAVDYARRLLAAFSDLRLTIGDLRQDSQIVNHKLALSEAKGSEIVNLIEPLSERELEVLRLIAAGLSNREIAEELVVAVSTIKTHVNNIYRKLDVSSRTQAIALARALKLM